MFDEKQSKLKSKPAKIAMVAIPIILIAGFFGFNALNDSGDKKTVTKKNATTTTVKKEDVKAPLTGLPDESGLSITRPALAVKIGNNPEARPQAGITKADIVYEEIVEGGITRYMAVFNSELPPRVGPVRSVRGMDPNIATNWGGLFAYSGGVPKNVSKIESAKGVKAINETDAGDGMKRDSKRGAPNNLYVQTAIMFLKDASPKPPIAQFEYSSKVSATAQVVTKFVVGFKAGFDCTWVYDSNTNEYLRFYGAKPVVDDEGTQVSVSNIVVQTINYPNESEGITTGSGKVQIFRDGKMISGTWDRPSNKKPATYKDSEGKTITLTPGQTWVELVSEKTPVSIK
jgi:hypothetical protein